MEADALVRNVVAFAQVLRAAGVSASPGKVSDALRGLDAVGVASREDVYWTLRQTLASGRLELDAFDAAFGEWVADEAPHEDVDGDGGLPVPERAPARGEHTEIDEERGWSAEESLRTTSFAALTDAETEEVARLIAALPVRRALRRTRRLHRHPAGRRMDMRSLARGALATGGDPVRWRSLRRRLVPRKVVFLCDVSGSMEPFARALLLFAHALVRSGPNVEVFAYGTRLTRLTPDLRRADADAVLGALSGRRLDWAGGTRIGESIKAFNDTWGRRGFGRGALVVNVSDGWERGDPTLLAAQMARLARTAYAVIWVNPHRSTPGYEPLAQGMSAALPYVDCFVSGQSFDEIVALADLIAGISHRHVVARPTSNH